MNPERVDPVLPAISSAARSAEQRPRREENAELLADIAAAEDEFGRAEEVEHDAAKALILARLRR